MELSIFANWLSSFSISALNSGMYRVSYMVWKALTSVEPNAVDLMYLPSLMAYLRSMIVWICWA